MDLSTKLTRITDVIIVEYFKEDNHVFVVQMTQVFVKAKQFLPFTSNRTKTRNFHQYLTDNADVIQ